MTDEEYFSFLRALARIHLGHFRPSKERADETRYQFERIAAAVRLWKFVRERRHEERYFYELLMEVEQSKPTETLYRIMEDAGLLNALEDSPSLLFGQFRKSAIPSEETEILKQAGFSDDEIEVLLADAVDQAHKMATHGIQPSNVIAETTVALNDAITRLKTVAPQEQKKKRKIFNGIGKILGGSAAGIGNVLLLTGSIIAPNPATIYAAIASGGIAVSTLFGGIGDLRGE